MSAQRRLDLGKVATGHREWFAVGPETHDPGPVPVFVARGPQDGLCCALVAGVHGDEYDGIVALTEIARTLDPSTLRGSVIVVPVANSLAFAAGVRKTPADGKDLNRVFPGTPTGSVTDRLADIVCDGILHSVDLVFSLHGSSASGELAPWIEYLDVPGALGRTTKLAAKASNFGDLIALPKMIGLLQTALAERNIAVIEGEVGGRAETTRPNVEYYKERVTNVLAHLGIVASAATKRVPVRVWRQQPVDCEQQGIFVAAVKLGMDVSAGETIGTILDGQGRVLSEIRSPTRGRIGGLRKHAGVQPGDRAVTLWVPAACDTQ